MTNKTRDPIRALALTAVALALVATLGGTSFDAPTRAAHGGMDVMSIDMDTSGNTSGTVGALQQCARINRNGSQDADEDVTDGIIIDITAQNIPVYNDGGTPGNPTDDTGGIIGYQYELNYPATRFTVGGLEWDNPAVNILASAAGSQVSGVHDTVPDNTANNTWQGAALDVADRAASPPESGNGVLDRLTIFADVGVGNGQYLLTLGSNFHLDASPDSPNDPLFPHSTNVANIAIGQPCSTLVTSYGYYHPVTPARILDTRTAPQGVPAGSVDHGETIVVDVTGVGNVPTTADVSAVVVNVTATGATAGSFLTVFPSDAALPTASNLNFPPGSTVPNLVTVRVGVDGNVKVYNAAGSTHVIFDVVGWYGGPTNGSRFNALEPARILDTRPNEPAPGPKGKIGPNSEITVSVTNVGGVPPMSSGVTAVVINTTATEPTNGSYLTVYPAGVARPTASNLNFPPGETVPNLVIVKVGVGGLNDGKVKVYNAVGSTHVIFDVVGWYGSSNGEVFNALSPERILDTRTSPQGVPAGAVGNNAEITVDVTGVGNVPASGASGIVVNTTITGPTQPSYLTVYPSLVVPRPTASNLNFTVSQTVPNLVIVKIGTDGNVKVYNAVGQVHVIFDVVGYFAPVPS